MDSLELPQEIQLLLRDITQAARTIIDVGGSTKYGVDMLRLCLRQEALRRTEENQCRAARLLQEQYKKPARAQSSQRVSAQAG
jgi:hypothetical protein